MSRCIYNKLKENESNNLRELIFRHKRQDPILLRFSNVLFTDEADEELMVEIEKEMGKSIILWTEPIVSEEDIIDVMVNLRKCGSNIPFGTNITHYMYGFFPNWVLDSNGENTRLIQNLAFYGEHDFWLSGGIGQNITTVRRVYEKSPEYLARTR
jgi:hypothetical protein